MLSYVICMALIATVGYSTAGAPGLVVGVVGFAIFDAMFATARRRQTRNPELARLIEHGKRRR